MLDANDNPPVFRKVSYKVTPRENTKIGSVIETVGATDLDTGMLGAVSIFGATWKHFFRNLNEFLLRLQKLLYLQHFICFDVRNQRRPQVQHPRWEH